MWICMIDRRNKNNTNATQETFIGTNKEAFYALKKFEILKYHKTKITQRSNQTNVIKIYAKHVLHKYAENLRQHATTQKT